MISKKLQNTLAEADAALTPEQRRTLGAGLTTLASSLVARSGGEACLRCEAADFWLWLSPPVPPAPMPSLYKKRAEINELVDEWVLSIRRCGKFLDLPKDERGSTLPAVGTFFCTAMTTKSEDE